MTREKRQDTLVIIYVVQVTKTCFAHEKNVPFLTSIVSFLHKMKKERKEKGIFGIHIIVTRKKVLVILTALSLTH